MCSITTDPNQNKNADELSFSAFMSAHKCSYDSSYTHVSMGFPKGIYQIGNQTLPQFWNMYSSVYKTHRQYIAEKQGEETPILVDVDLKIKLSDSKDFDESILYTQEQVKAVVMAYQQSITDHVNFEGCDETKQTSAYTCVLLEKKPYMVEQGGIYYKKGGFHLHFPKIFLTKREHANYIIPKAKLLTKGLFNNLGIEDFIDAGVLGVNWLLYGSSKISSEAYTATKCFLKEGEATTLENGLNDYKVAVFHKEEASALKCDNHNIISMLPRILSVFLYNRFDDYYFNIKTYVPSPLLNDIGVFCKQIRKFNEKSVEEQLKEADILLDMIHESRADSWDTWMKIGWCLHSISEGSVQGFVSWCNFSSRSNKYNESECISAWQNMRDNSFSIGTLKYFAKFDNPEMYKEHTRNYTKKLFKVAIEGGHNDLAKILHNEFNNEFVCVSIRGKEWYQFKNHIWHINEVGTGLRERISNNNSVILTHLQDIKDETMKKIYEQNYEETDDEETDDEENGDECTKKDKNKKKIKQINKLMSNCKSAPFKHNIMVEAQEMFYNERFLSLLNKNPYLIAFKNGVYDFQADVFREGTPEDYLSSCLPINYVDYKTTDHPQILQIEDFFRKIFPDDSLREYFLYQASQVFIGGNRAKIILFWTGEGNNGKTVTQYLFERMLGPMAVKFSTALITGKKKDLGTAAPELARSGGGVRWAVMDEPNADETILSGTLKALTGNDSFFARDLFQKGKETVEITPLFKLHMICNKPPVIKDADKATWNRIRVVRFESTFLPANECPSTVEEQIRQKKFPVDKNFSSDTVPKLLEPLAWFLINQQKLCKDVECVEPESVKIATEMFRQDNDIYKQFEEQSTFYKENSTVTITNLYTFFKDWIQQEYPHVQVPSRAACRSAFIDMWGPLTKRGWLNRAIGTSGED
jgi:P4 family phage/plasmid primase-like protien